MLLATTLCNPVSDKRIERYLIQDIMTFSRVEVSKLSKLYYTAQTAGDTLYFIYIWR